MPRRKDYTQQIAAAWTRVVNNCGCDDLYYCLTGGDIECPRHSGFTACCKHPGRHIPVTTPDTNPATHTDTGADASADPTTGSTKPTVHRSPFAIPHINTDNLNFDDFHPLDHTLAECVGYPGGRRRHLTYWWEFHARPWIHAHTLCRLGLHKSTIFKGRNDPHTDDWHVWDGCLHCHKRLSQPQPL